MNTPGRDCIICLKSFNVEFRQPRILPCFHTFCTACIDLLVASKKKNCPFCGKSFKANKASDVQVNQAALDLIKYYTSFESYSPTSHDIKDSQENQKHENNYSRVKESVALLLTRSEGSRKNIEKVLEENQKLRWVISQELARLEELVVVQITQIVSHHKTAQKELLKCSEELNFQLLEIGGKSAKLQTIYGRITTFGDHSFKDSECVIQEADKEVGVIEKELKELETRAQEGEDLIKNAKKDILRTQKRIDNFQEVRNPQEEGAYESESDSRNSTSPSKKNSTGQNGDSSSSTKSRKRFRIGFKRTSSKQPQLAEYDSLGLCVLQSLNKESIPMDFQVIDPFVEETESGSMDHVEGFIIL